MVCLLARRSSSDQLSGGAWSALRTGEVRGFAAVAMVDNESLLWDGVLHAGTSATGNRRIGARGPAGGTLVFKGSDLNETGPVTLPEARW